MFTEILLNRRVRLGKLEELLLAASTNESRTLDTDEMNGWFSDADSQTEKELLVARAEVEEAIRWNRIGTKY
jgi:hypothetical protein